MGHSDTHRRLHDLFNSRNFDELDQHLAADYRYEDAARDIVVQTREDFKAWLSGWPAAFSDAIVGQPTYVDGADHSVSMFRGQGTNDGPLGPFPPSGQRMDLPFCEVIHFASDGTAQSGSIYYDQVSMLTQLGHMPAPSEHRAAEPDDLEDTTRQLFASFDNLDLETLKTQLARDGQGVDELSRRWMRDEETIVSYFRQLKDALTDVHSELSDIHTVNFGDTGIATLWLEQDYTIDGNRQHVSAPTTIVFRREDSNWKAALVHSIPLPEDTA